MKLEDLKSDKLIENYSSDVIEYQWIHPNGGRVKDEAKEKKRDACVLSVIWRGKMDPDSEIDEEDIYKRYRCEFLDVTDVSHANQIKLHLKYAYEFKPTVGDKLQTPTSQKGVITQLLGDEEMPYVTMMNDGQVYLPDMIVNPQFVKRQSFDYFPITGQFLNKSIGGINGNDNASLYFEDCFSVGFENASMIMQLGEKLLTGKVMNPVTGLPYLQPVSDPKPEVKYYYHPYPDAFVDEDGFYCIDKRKRTNEQRQLFKIVYGSLYFGKYYCVNNHNINLYYSKPGHITKTEFTETPIRGKKGGFSTGPQEHLSLVGMGMTYFPYELTQLRSDPANVCLVRTSGCRGNKKRPITDCLEHEEEEEEDGNERDVEVISASHTFLRGNDELNQRLDVSYEIDTLCTVDEIF